MTRTRMWAGVMALAVTVSCSGDVSGPEPAPPGPAGFAAMRIEPGNAWLTSIGDRVQLHVVGLAVDDQGILSWSSLDPDVAMIDHRGLVEAITWGVARIVVRLNDASGVELTASVLVKQPDDRF